MKKVILILCAVISYITDAQEALYISTQTGEFTRMNGFGTAETDDNESGSCDCSSTGPIVYNISHTSIENNQQLNISGYVNPDPDAAPAPGTSASARITCNCNWNWLTWNDDTGEKDKPMSASHSDEMEFEVYSIEIKLPDTISCSCGSFVLAYSSVFPEGGTVDWDTPWGPETGNNIAVPYDPTYEGETITATYTVEGVTYKATSVLGNQLPYLSLSVGNCDGYKATVEVDADEDCGTLSWAGYGTDDCSGTSCEVDVSPNLAAQEQKITVSYQDDCGNIVSETVSITMGKLTGFSLPPCDTTHNIDVANLAILDFEGQCKPNVVYSPTTLSPPSVLPYETIEVTATAGDVTLTSSIIMVNAGAELDATVFSLNTDFLGVFESYLQAILGLGSPCSMSGSFRPTGSISIGNRPLCCADSGLTTGTSVKGNLSWGLGWGCRGPIFGVPYTGSVDAVFNVGVSGSLGVDGVEECTAIRICGTAGFSASISGGIGFTLAAGLVQGDLQLVIDGASISLSYCFTPQSGGSYTYGFGAGKIQGTVSEVWGLISHSVSYPLWSGASYGPYDL